MVDGRWVKGGWMVDESWMGGWMDDGWVVDEWWMGGG